MSCEVVTTRDGARAILDHGTGEVMHPVVGPAVESMRLYCEPARLAMRLRAGDGPLVLFDVGLGAGSNAIAAWRISESFQEMEEARRLEIVSFDHSLAAMQLALQHPGDFGFEAGAGAAARGLLEHGCHETGRTRWRVVQGSLPGVLAAEPAGSADVVFWDPFSPRANPELWTVGAFTALRRCCRGRATVHTYSGATAVRSALLLAGFAVGVGEATGEHKAATCAAIELGDLEQPLDRRWLARLGRSTAGFPADAPADALARIAALPQFA
jgi:queuine tRNA-ribosyltransferase